MLSTERRSTGNTAAERTQSPSQDVYDLFSLIASGRELTEEEYADLGLSELDRARIKEVKDWVFPDNVLHEDGADNPRCGRLVLGERATDIVGENVYLKPGYDDFGGFGEEYQPHPPQDYDHNLIYDPNGIFVALIDGEKVVVPKVISLRGVHDGRIDPISHPYNPDNEVVEVIADNMVIRFNRGKGEGTVVFKNGDGKSRTAWILSDDESAKEEERKQEEERRTRIAGGVGAVALDDDGTEEAYLPAA